MKLNPLIIAPIAYLLFKGGSSVYNASRLNFFVAKLVPRFQGLTPVIDIYIGVQNPTRGTFRIESFTGNVYANTTLLGNMSSFTLTNVGSNSQTYFIATLRLSLVGVVQEIFNKIQGGVSSINYTMKIDGTINVNGFPVPVLLSYKII